MDSVVAAHLLEQVDAVGEQTRRLVRSLWYPFVLWGVLAGGGAVTEVALPDHQGWYWLSASVVGLCGTALYYRRRSLRIGAFRQGCRLMVIGGAACVVVMAASIVLPGVATPWVAVGILYQLMARAVGSWTVAAAGWLLIGAGLAGQLALGGPAAVVTVNSACCVVLVATGIVLRSQQQAATRDIALTLAG